LRRVSIKESSREAKPLLDNYFPLYLKGVNIKESSREAKPLLDNYFPFPLIRGRG